MTGFIEEPSTHPRSTRGTRAADSVRSDALRVCVQSVAELTVAERQAMWQLYERFYAGSSQSRFTTDLDEKRAVLLLRDAQSTLQGFTTLRWWDREFDGAVVRILFSGDTIIDRAHWGTQALAFNWLRFAGALKRANPNVALYWFLIVKGQRTYRYLPAFARLFIPNRNDDAPPGWNRLLDELAQERFGDAYDAASGVVRFAQSMGHLAPEWATVTARERSRPDMQFFLERNPGYARGDELVCLCELSAENLRPLARRVFEDERAA